MNQHLTFEVNFFHFTFFVLFVLLMFFFKKKIFCKIFLYISLQNPNTNCILFCKCLRNRSHLVNADFDRSYIYLIFFTTHQAYYF